jgi:hypothetical protein
MAPRRKVIPVTLTSAQREKLERLWFLYGNHGPKTTRGNHAFIQRLLQHGMDIRPLSLKGYMPTAECEQTVEAVLSNNGKSAEEISGAAKEHKLKLISTPAQQHSLKGSKASEGKDSELKDLIRSLMKKGERNRSKPNQDDDMPPAA